MTTSRSPRGGQCQCGGCGRFFTSLSGFDFHQWWAGRGDHTHLVCLPPEQIGMALHPSTTGETWMLPGQDAEPGAAEAARKALIALWGRQEGPETALEAP